MEESHMAADPPTILIVDDEEAALNVCKHLLRKMGFNVIEANNSSDAYRIARASKGAIDAAIVDYSLPSVQDETFSKHLSQIDPGMKIMLTAGYCEFGPISELIKEEGQEVIQKPFNRAQLDKKLRAVLS
jgi:DNA-binding NtrC family response regulator